MSIAFSSFAENHQDQPNAEEVDNKLNLVAKITPHAQHELITIIVVRFGVGFVISLSDFCTNGGFTR